MLAKVRALYCQARHFHKTCKSLTQRRHYQRNVCYKNLSQFNETLSFTGNIFHIRTELSTEDNFFESHASTPVESKCEKG